MSRVTTQPDGANGEVQWHLGTAPDTKSTIDTGQDAICATCPHPWKNHDRIAARYCTATATATAGQSRGCVCVNKETS